MVMGAYARKHSRYHRSVECETDGALQILWNLWELHRFAKVLQICETGVMEKQETQRPNVLADVEEIYEYPKDTSNGVSKDISEKCLLGKCLIEEPYALIGHVRFCEGLLRLEPLIAKQYMVKGCEKVETKSTRRHMRILYDEYTSGILAEYAYCIQLGHDMHIGDTYPIGKIWNGVGNISEILRNRKISVEDEDGEIYTLFFRIIKKKSQILRTTVEIIDAD